MNMPRKELEVNNKAIAEYFAKGGKVTKVPFGKSGKCIPKAFSSK